MVATPKSIEEIENIVFHLNYRWVMESLAAWKGEKSPIGAYKVYEGFEKFLNPHVLATIDTIKDSEVRKRLKYSFIDHCLQHALLPHESEMRGWMRGAAAHVNGEKIYFREIIPWCQKKSTKSQRRILQQEVGPLCKFLRPFALNYWELLLKLLKETFGFEDYISYCSDKKSVDYHYFYSLAQDLLDKTDDLYFSCMEQWVRKRFNASLHELTRFDAICILGMGEFDDEFSQKEIKRLTQFFRYWNIDLTNTPGLYLDLGKEPKKSAQAMCFILQVPDEIYILVKPQGGWMDVETIWHELGHGLFAAFTSPHLGYVLRELATTNCLSETFAFLIQNIASSVPFLTEVAGVDEEFAQRLYYHKVLRDLSIFRRYAARFLSEYRMFAKEDLGNGQVYSDLMTRYTGFYYQPESALFDLVPEFYSLDYVMAWMAEAMLENHMKEKFGERWMFESEAGRVLKTWWQAGNSLNVFDFLHKNKVGPLSPECLLRRWAKVLS